MRLVEITLCCALLSGLLPVCSLCAEPQKTSNGASGRLEMLNAYQRELYPAYAWSLPGGLPNLTNPPELEEGESIDFWSSVVSFHGSVAWVIQSGSGKERNFSLLVWKFGNREGRRILTGPQRIWGLAWSPGTDRVLVGRGKQMLFLDPDTLQVAENRNFSHKGNRTDLAVAGNRLIVRNGLEIAIHDLTSLEKTGEATIPKKSVQRMTGYDDRRVLLSSTYWGADTYLFDLEGHELEGPVRLTGPMHRHVLMKSAVMEKGRLGIFDLANKKFLGVMERDGNDWICLSCNLEALPDHRGYRFSPVHQELTGRLTITAERDTPATYFRTFLYPAHTYGQEIRDEHLAEGSRVDLDKLGNRYLIIPVPAMKKGDVFEREVYSSRITRYTVKLHPEKFSGDLAVPDEMKVYLQDDQVLDMDNPVVVKKLAELTAGLVSPAEKIVAIHRYAATIPYLDDKRYDPAPRVILNNHGGCNEHTRVQLALLRLAGIPSRFAWNTLADPGPRLLKIDHAIAEAWLPGFGWLPMEGLGGTAGYLRPYVIASINHAGPSDFKKRLKLDAPLFSKNFGKASFVYELRNFEPKQREQEQVEAEGQKPHKDGIDLLRRSPEQPAEFE